MTNYSQFRFTAIQAAPIYVGGLLAPEHLTSAVRKVIDENPGEVAEIVSGGYTGESCIIDPQGRVIAGPLEGEEILIADCCEEQIFLAKAECDVAGHYSRPDVFQLRANRAPHHRVVEMQEPDSETTEFETGDMVHESQ